MKKKILEIDIIMKAFVEAPEEADNDDIVNNMGAFIVNAKKAYKVKRGSIDDIDVVKTVQKGAKP